MSIFSTTGDKHNDLWLVDGSADFSIFPAGIIQEIIVNIPIHLKVGNPSFGAKHIQNKHSVWYKKQGFKSVPELVFFKLAQPGIVYCTESESKLKITMQLKPSAVLVMEYKPNPSPHFSVTTIYHHQSTLDGIPIGRYPGRR